MKERRVHVCGRTTAAVACNRSAIPSGAVPCGEAIVSPASHFPSPLSAEPRSPRASSVGGTAGGIKMDGTAIGQISPASQVGQKSETWKQKRANMRASVCACVGCVCACARLSRGRDRGVKFGTAVGRQSVQTARCLAVSAALSSPGRSSLSRHVAPWEPFAAALSRAFRRPGASAWQQIARRARRRTRLTSDKPGGGTCCCGVSSPSSQPQRGRVVLGQALWLS